MGRRDTKLSSATTTTPAERSVPERQKILTLTEKLEP